MIELESISYAAGKFSIEDISLRVDDGETLVILGPTGAGKTVLLELVAGIRRPASGSILTDGSEITHLPPERRGVGLVYQDYLLFPHLDVLSNIEYGLRCTRLRAADRRRKAEEMALQMGIGHLLDRRTRNLSGGEQQRIALARALVTDPSILLLDEPFSAVDPGTRERLMREMNRLIEPRDIPVLYVTHDQDEAFEMADSIAVMNEGRIVQLDRPENVFRSPKSEFVADFVGVRNVFRASASRRDGNTVVAIGEVQIGSSIELEGEVHVTIRPEDIIVSKQRFESSARNSLSGRVRAIVERGPVVHLTAECGGLEITAAITRESFRELQIMLEDEVFMTFKASNVNLF